MVKEENKEKWLKLIKEQKSSGLFQNRWCERKGIKYSQFKYYLLKLRT